MLEELGRLARNARRAAPRPWVPLLAMGGGLLAVSFYHAQCSADPLPSREKQPDGCTQPVENRPATDLFLQGAEQPLAPRPSGPNGNPSISPPPEMSHVFGLQGHETLERGTSGEINAGHNNPPPARGPPAVAD